MDAFYSMMTAAVRNENPGDEFDRCMEDAEGFIRRVHFHDDTVSEIPPFGVVIFQLFAFLNEEAILQLVERLSYELHDDLGLACVLAAKSFVLRNREELSAKEIFNRVFDEMDVDIRI